MENNLFMNYGGNPNPSPKTEQEKFIELLNQNGITSPRAQANILAQIEAESNFNPQSESLNYTPEKIYKLFPNKFKNLDDAREVVKEGREALGNRIYGSRMGNSENEGYKYRGRGYIQLTGKNNYEKYGKLLGIDLVNNPELANDPEIAKKIAITYMQNSNVDLDNLSEVNKAIGYKQNDSENKRRLSIANKYYTEFGLETINTYTSNNKKTQVPINPSKSVFTVDAGDSHKKMMKSLNNWKAKQNHFIDPDKFDDSHNVSINKKENPKGLDDLYLKPTKRVDFGKLPEFQY